MHLQFGLAGDGFKPIKGETYDFPASIRVVSGIRSWAAFQVVVSGDTMFDLHTDTDTHFSTYGLIPQVRLEVISPVGVTVAPVGFMQDDDDRFKGDILLSERSVHVDGFAQSVWVELETDEHTAPGLYTGEIKIHTHTQFEPETLMGVLQFELDVKHYVMPRPSEYSFYLDLFQFNSNLSRKLGVERYSDAHFEALEHYVAALADLGQKAVSIFASDAPFIGQSCFNFPDNRSDLFEYSMIKTVKERDGRIHCDFTACERYIELCFKHGIDQEIEVFGLLSLWEDAEGGFGRVCEDYPDAIRLRYWDQADGCYKFMTDAPDIDAYIRALEQFFLEKGLMDKVRIEADEPSNLDKFNACFQRIMSVAPSFKVKTTINNANFIKTFGKNYADLVPSMECLCNEWKDLQEVRASDGGVKRYLWYNCCVPDYPNTFLKSPLLETRLIGYLTAYAELDGFLRWNYTAWTENPRENSKYWWPVGDTHFVMPGNNGRPLLTLRYKMLKKSIEDFELLHALKASHIDVSAIWDRIFTERDINRFMLAPFYSQDYADYENARETMLTMLENSTRES